MSEENTNTYPMNMLVAVILVVGVFLLMFLVYYPQVAEGSEELDAQAKCVKMGEIRHEINQIDLSPIPGTTGQSITETSLLELPAGCGRMYTKPCNSTADCQQNIRDSLSKCWENIQREPETTGTCLLSLEVNASVTDQLCMAEVCSGGGKFCGLDTEVPKDNLDYGACPQDNDNIAMEYGKTWWGLGSDNIIKVKCLGKCEV